MRRFFVVLAHGIGFVLLLPFFLWDRLPFSEYSTFTAASQILSLIPGVFGILLRRVWYSHTLAKCGSNLTVDWLGVIRTRGSEIGSRCTFGVANWVGWVKMGSDVMLGSHVVLLSGGRQHSFSDLNIPMRLQHGTKQQLQIGDDVWIGAHAVVMADVSPGTVIGAASVVTRTHASHAVIAGNPARILRMREEQNEGGSKG